LKDVPSGTQSPGEVIKFPQTSQQIQSNSALTMGYCGYGFGLVQGFLLHTRDFWNEKGALKDLRSDGSFDDVTPLQIKTWQLMNERGAMTALPPGFVERNGHAWNPDTGYISQSEAWDIYSSKYPIAMKSYSDLAELATKNKDSKVVVLGKYNIVGRSYDKVAEEIVATYFNLENWSEVEGVLGKENMWNINKEFLNQQWAESKEFYFSHNPWEAGGYFEQEVLHLIDLGVKDFIEIEDNLWKAVK